MLTGYMELTKLWKLWDLPKQRALGGTDVILAAMAAQEEARGEAEAEVAEEEGGSG